MNDSGFLVPAASAAAAGESEERSLSLAELANMPLTELKRLAEGVQLHAILEARSGGLMSWYNHTP